MSPHTNTWTLTNSHSSDKSTNKKYWVMIRHFSLFTSGPRWEGIDAERPLDGALDPQEEIKEGQRILLDVQGNISIWVWVLVQRESASKSLFMLEKQWSLFGKWHQSFCGESVIVGRTFSDRKCSRWLEKKIPQLLDGRLLIATAGICTKCPQKDVL